MNNRLRFLVLAVALVIKARAEPALPHLRPQGTATQLVVDGQPFLIRGGELGNSSGEPAYLRPFWPKLKALNLNTVVAPAYWDLLEPAEGHFDFASVDGLVADARSNGMKLVLLWFGSWKNSMSCYVPGWIKSDAGRFPRSRDASGRSLEILSPFHAGNRDTDVRAFGALMKHLRETDAAATVVMVQVENEIGMIPDARDHSTEADQLFNAAVPAALTDYLAKHVNGLAPELRAIWLSAGGRANGTWTEVFGAGPTTEEIFTAWHFANYTEAVTTAGKAEYPLPMYANAALIRPGHQPGQYPSGGPLPHLIDIWRAGAPHLDFIAPDIYFPNFVEWTRRYTRSGNPLFIPEALRSTDAAANALYAFGGCDAIGFSPFGIESVGEPASSWLRDGFDVIAQLTPLIVRSQGLGSMAGLLKESPEQVRPQQVRLGGYVLNATFEQAPPPALADGVTLLGGTAMPSGGAATLPAGAIAIAMGPDEFLFAGIGVTVTFESLDSKAGLVGLLSVEEGKFVNGQWEHLRWLNGDQTHQGRHMRLEPGRFCIQRVKLYRYR